MRWLSCWCFLLSLSLFGSCCGSFSSMTIPPCERQRIKRRKNPCIRSSSSSNTAGGSTTSIVSDVVGTTSAPESIILISSEDRDRLDNDDADTAAVERDEEESSSIITNRRPHLIFPGAGIFFYWQAGVVTYLRKAGYELIPSSSSSSSSGSGVGVGGCGVTFVGASAGSLTSTLAITNVDYYYATKVALDLAASAGIWDRPTGLQGVWGPLIREWLDIILPKETITSTPTSGDGNTINNKNVMDDLLNINDDRLTLLVSKVPWGILGNKERISQFKNRDDLIDVNMASVHLPWFLDGQLTATLPQRQEHDNTDGPYYMDGSIFTPPYDYRPPSLSRSRSSTSSTSTTSKRSSSSSSSSMLMFDYRDDPKYQSSSFIDFVKALSPDSIYQLLEDGQNYAKQLDEMGKLTSLYKNKTIL